jgi:hypothetical protein
MVEIPRETGVPKIVSDGRSLAMAGGMRGLRPDPGPHWSVELELNWASLLPSACVALAVAE